ncbi:MAG: hypothetical protein ACK56I_36310, partial [bacterium]
WERGVECADALCNSSVIVPIISRKTFITGTRNKPWKLLPTLPPPQPPPSPTRASVVAGLGSRPLSSKLETVEESGQ